MFEIESVPHSSATGNDSKKPVSAQQILGELANKIAENSAIEGTTAMTQEISTEVLLEKYAEPGETTVEDVRRRVARGLAQAEKPEQRAHWEEAFFLAQEQLSILIGPDTHACGRKDFKELDVGVCPRPIVLLLLSAELDTITRNDQLAIAVALESILLNFVGELLRVNL